MMGLPTCREVAAELSREYDAPESHRRSREMKLHLLMWRDCRRCARQLAWMQQALTRARSPDVTGPGLPATVRARIRNRLRNERLRPPV